MTKTSELTGRVRPAVCDFVLCFRDGNMRHIRNSLTTTQENAMIYFHY